MLRTTFIAVTAFLMLGSTASSAPIQWTTGPGANGHYYEFVDSPVDWNTASQDAFSSTHLGESGYLVTIHSAEEAQFIFDSVTTATSWSGLNDIAVEGIFVWNNGEPVTYTNWNGGEPNNAGNEDAVSINAAGTRWNDLSATHLLPYIIEYNGVIPVPAPVPVPGAFALLGIGLLGLRFKRSNTGCGVHSHRRCG